jgi:Vacuolar-sorting-associated 13 protein C-terminal
VARILQLADVEGVTMWLAALELRHPLLGADALMHQISRHYTRALLNEAYKVVASVDILGKFVLWALFCYCRSSSK